MPKLLCTFPGFLKYPFSFTSAWPVFSSLSLPDEPLTIDVASPIVICSYDTHRVSYPAYDRASTHDTLSLLLCDFPVGLNFGILKSTIKMSFSRTVRARFRCTWHEDRDTRVPEIGLCILLWPPFEVAHSAFPEILNVYCLQNSFLWAPLSLAGWPLLLFQRCWQPLSHLFILSFCKHSLCGRSSA